MFLHAKNMVGGYGETTILNNCSINVKQGEIAVIVGPNGAGKSTAMKAIFGMLDLRQGNVFFDGEDITYLSPQDRVKKGMGFVPQTNNVFTSMTVLENLEIGGFTNLDKIKSNIKEIFNLFPILEEKQKQIVGELSGGQRQQVAVGRALMTNPKLLMLDEPTAGVSPIVVKELFEKIINIAKAGIAILMVEQNAKQALEISDNGFVLVQGENKFTDKGITLLENREVREKLFKKSVLRTEGGAFDTNDLVKKLVLLRAKKAKVLLLDEPASGLDPLASTELSTTLKTLSDKGTTVLMASHDIFRVRETCDRIGILRNGSLIDQMDTANVTTNELEKIYIEYMRN